MSAHEKDGTQSVPRLERPDDVVNIFDEHQRCVCQTAQPGLRGQDVPAEDQTTLRVYLTSGAGDPPENTRSNVARSALGKSETAM
jgi:hypothetical protein